MSRRNSSPVVSKNATTLADVATWADEIRPQLRETTPG